MNYENILYETSDRICRIILNRPEKMNALSWNLRQEILDALKVAERDDTIRVIIIKGAGRCFSSGYDLTPEDPSPNMPEDGYVSPRLDWITSQYPRNLIASWWTIWDLLKPVIAQIHGYCLAGGSELASMCDLRIVAEDAVIGYPPARNLSVGDVMYHPWLMGMSKAKEFLFTGDPMSGKEGVTFGWANQAYPVDELEEETEKLARRIALIDTDLICFNKRAVNRAYEIMGMRAAMDSAADHTILCSFRESADEFMRTAREKGLKAALEQRDGAFGDYSAAKKKKDDA